MINQYDIKDANLFFEDDDNDTFFEGTYNAVLRSIGMKEDDVRESIGKMRTEMTPAMRQELKPLFKKLSEKMKTRDAEVARIQNDIQNAESMGGVFSGMKNIVKSSFGKMKDVAEIMKAMKAIKEKHSK